MSESGVRELFRDVTADAVLGESTVDIDAVIGRERRAGVRRRVGVIAGAAAVVVALAVAVPVVVGGRGPDPSPFVSAGPTVTATPAPLATREEREAFAVTALLEHFPGAVRRPVDYSHWDGRVNVEAELPGPPRAVVVFVEALRVQERPEHPCGPTNPPRCAEYPQPDGSMVIVQRIPPTGQETLQQGGQTAVVAIHMRTNGTHVQVGVVYDPGPSAPTYADEVMVRAALDPRFTAMAPGTGG
jgi:hypothetical protein